VSIHHNPKREREKERRRRRRRRRRRIGIAARTHDMVQNSPDGDRIHPPPSVASTVATSSSQQDESTLVASGTASSTTTTGLEEEEEVIVHTVEEGEREQTRDQHLLQQEEEEENHPAATDAIRSSSSSSTPTTADELMGLLRRVRGRDATLEQIVLDRTPRLPAVYVRALLEALGAGGGGGCNGNGTSRTSSLLRLRLYRIGLTDREHSGMLSNAIRANPSLVDLDLARNALTGGALSVLAAAILETCTTTNDGNQKYGGGLRRLVLEGNFLSESGVRDLFRVVPHTNLEILRMGKNRITLLAMQTISDVLLRRDCRIRKLDLRDCQLEDEAVLLLARAVRANISLRYLSLGRNNVSDASVHALADALHWNCTLLTLDLQSNPAITDASVSAILDCLTERNNSLQKLKLRNCHGVSAQMKERLLDELLVNGHGPDLAKKTKQAETSLLLELTERWDDSNNHSSVSDSSMSSCDDEEERDGGETGTVREVPAVSAEISASGLSRLRAVFPITDCVICFEEGQVSCALLPCKHRNCCEPCARRLQTCHMCREVVVKRFASSSMLYYYSFCCRGGGHGAAAAAATVPS
jgi:Zinc finger, C3HC4 type (RING finger)/Leucine Rich repeat